MLIHSSLYTHNTRQNLEKPPKSLILLQNIPRVCFYEFQVQTVENEQRRNLLDLPEHLENRTGLSKPKLKPKIKTEHRNRDRARIFEKTKTDPGFFIFEEADPGPYLRAGSAMVYTNKLVESTT